MLLAKSLLLAESNNLPKRTWFLNYQNTIYQEEGNLPLKARFLRCLLVDLTDILKYQWRRLQSSILRESQISPPFTASFSSELTTTLPPSSQLTFDFIIKLELVTDDKRCTSNWSWSSDKQCNSSNPGRVVLVRLDATRLHQYQEKTDSSRKHQVFHQSTPLPGVDQSIPILMPSDSPINICLLILWLSNTQK